MKPILTCMLASLLLALSAQQAQAADDEAPRCRYVAIAKLPLHYTGPYLEITTRGVINGTPALMLVDTGAYDSFLTRQGAERRNMRLSNTGRVAQGVGGFSSIYQTQVQEFVAGSARSEPGTMRVLSDFGAAPSYDAILGAPFLMQADLEISLASKELKFFQPINCADDHLGYWDPAALAVPLEANINHSPNPPFTVLVNGQKMRAIIDTGAQVSSISLAAARRAGLKLDAPGVKRAADIVGVGENRMTRWHTVLETFQIGEETIRNADVSVTEGLDSIDVLLGADFLRSHRVLFALSQRKLYFSYVGGEPFDQGNRLAPWIQAEAEAGNTDAQMMLSSMYATGKKVARDPALAIGWLEKAALGGNAHANIATGRQLLLQDEPAEAAARLRAGLDKLPANRPAALWLYLARVRSAQPELARTELGTAFARGNDDAWPAPIAAFYLGKIDENGLLKQASEDRVHAATRRCQALVSMTEWYRAHGNGERADAIAAQSRQECRPAASVTGSHAVQSEDETS